MALSQTTKKNMTKGLLYVGAVLLLCLALGYWKAFIVLAMVGGALVFFASEVKPKSKLAWWAILCTVFALLYGNLFYPSVSTYMWAHHPGFWSAVQQQMVAKDLQYGREHSIAGNGIDAIDQQDALDMDAAVAERYYEDTRGYVEKVKRGEEPSRADSIAYRNAKLKANQKRETIQQLMGGGTLEVSESTGNHASVNASSAASGYARTLKVDITSPEPTELDIPQGSNLIVWVVAAHYTGYDSLGTKHPGARYTSSMDEYEQFFCGAGGFSISPRKSRSTFANAFFAPDLNMFSTIFCTSIQESWNMVPPEGMLTIRGSMTETVTAMFTINDRLTTMEGNSGGLVLGYRYQPISRTSL